MKWTPGEDAALRALASRHTDARGFPSWVSCNAAVRAGGPSGEWGLFYATRVHPLDRGSSQDHSLSKRWRLLARKAKEEADAKTQPSTKSKKAKAGAGAPSRCSTKARKPAAAARVRKAAAAAPVPTAPAAAPAVSPPASPRNASAAVVDAAPAPMDHDGCVDAAKATELVGQSDVGPPVLHARYLDAPAAASVPRRPRSSPCAAFTRASSVAAALRASFSATAAASAALTCARHGALSAPDAAVLASLSARASLRLMWHAVVPGGGGCDAPLCAPMASALRLPTELCGVALSLDGFDFLRVSISVAGGNACINFVERSSSPRFAALPKAASSRLAIAGVAASVLATVGDGGACGYVSLEAAAPQHYPLFDGRGFAADTYLFDPASAPVLPASTTASELDAIVRRKNAYLNNVFYPNLFAVLSATGATAPFDGRRPHACTSFNAASCGAAKLPTWMLPHAALHPGSVLFKEALILIDQAAAARRPPPTDPVAAAASKLTSCGIVTHVAKLCARPLLALSARAWAGAAGGDDVPLAAASARRRGAEAAARVARRGGCEARGAFVAVAVEEELRKGLRELACPLTCTQLGCA